MYLNTCHYRSTIVNSCCQVLGFQLSGTQRKFLNMSMVDQLCTDAEEREDDKESVNSLDGTMGSDLVLSNSMCSSRNETLELSLTFVSSTDANETRNCFSPNESDETTHNILSVCDAVDVSIYREAVSQESPNSSFIGFLHKQLTASGLDLVGDLHQSYCSNDSKLVWEQNVDETARETYFAQLNENDGLEGIEELLEESREGGESPTQFDKNESIIDQGNADVLLNSSSHTQPPTSVICKKRRSNFPMERPPSRLRIENEANMQWMKPAETSQYTHSQASHSQLNPNTRSQSTILLASQLVLENQSITNGIELVGTANFQTAEDNQTLGIDTNKQSQGFGSQVLEESLNFLDPVMYPNENTENYNLDVSVNRSPSLLRENRDISPHESFNIVNFDASRSSTPRHHSIDDYELLNRTDATMEIINLPLQETSLRDGNLNILTGKNSPLSTGSNENLTDPQKRIRSALNRITMDKELVYKGPRGLYGEKIEEKNQRLIQEVENFFYKMLVKAVNKKPFMMNVQLCNLGNCTYENGIVELKKFDKCIFQQMCTWSRPRRRFNIIVYLLARMYALCIRGSECTIREIYYCLKEYMQCQREIEDAVNIISCFLEIEHWYLPIMSTSKGLALGALTVYTSAGEVINFNVAGGLLIPQKLISVTKIESDAHCILVVEKDTIFKKLADENFSNKLTRPFILVTGKGFPDINTRLFLRILRDHLRIPIFILVDADPWGIDIMLTYRHGSVRTANLSEVLALSNIKWLGVLPSEIVTLGIAHTSLTERDKGKIRSMLRRPYVADQIKEELNVLLENDFKAGIEGVIKTHTYLTNFYLTHKFANRDYL
ncbi:hypothetical protein PPYR_08161 [Photinus pyralis]|uniref:DNA topoisomerase (ATP-hydrolyzing) n=2 Tax=Photinus pyralis TaxID=7054 RepID=A0A5N4AIL3_PHOPY|nr:uncharacterized protein LOC116170409 isoform X1 [Photinus pyralis]XP_031342642.1 uncharacterized protein LOC116170409 isoform X1 [Photinus pyralis]XP_031343370.1 uncharacterized protein LOC116170938 isoform X1 [Photinus pyralis]XP_031343371.1 uncharacterized protein LOC116170938 isoform X1 [Photinus pyralis]KAB0797167.1 hypothetical protein PPYR_08161 [Photinus pyralis]